MFSIQMPPLDLEAPDPPLEEFLILTMLDPFPNGCWPFFIGVQESYHLLVLSHLSSIPLAFRLRLLKISAQPLLKLYQ
jgi:hypothetical protein